MMTEPTSEHPINEEIKNEMRGAVGLLTADLVFGTDFTGQLEDARLPGTDEDGDGAPDRNPLATYVIRGFAGREQVCQLTDRDCAAKGLEGFREIASAFLDMHRTATQKGSA